jgi:hypothetical protein
MANKKPLNLDALVNAGKNVETSAKLDLSNVGGKLIAPPHVAGGERVDLSSCYGETGRALDKPETD